VPVSMRKPLDLPPPSPLGLTSQPPPPPFVTPRPHATAQSQSFWGKRARGAPVSTSIPPEFTSDLARHEAPLTDEAGVLDGKAPYDRTLTRRLEKPGNLTSNKPPGANPHLRVCWSLLCANRALLREILCMDNPAVCKSHI